MLTPAQTDAIFFVREYAKARKQNALVVIDHILQMSNLSRSKLDQLIDATKAKTRVAFHFHPDRLDPHMKTVAEALLECGIYKSQFETSLSSGSVSAHNGGARDIWEKQLFGGAYQQVGVGNSHRPKYGALDLLSHPDGPSPRFGSCYFLLKSEVTRRCTFTYLDSHQCPKERGTFDEFDDILAALLSDSFSDEVVLGEQLRPSQLLDHFVICSEKSFDERLRAPHRRILDHYVEAQVHGAVALQNDVEFLVADPSFKGTTTGEHLEAICKKYDITLHWHAGFILETSQVPLDFRGPGMPSLSKKVAPDGLLDIKKIGDAAASLKRNPREWVDRGSEKDVLQELKLLWHILLRFGSPVK